MTGSLQTLLTWVVQTSQCSLVISHGLTVMKDMANPHTVLVLKHMQFIEDKA